MHSKNESVDSVARDVYRTLLNQENLILEVTEALCFTMKLRGLSRAEVAKRLAKSKGFVSQLLNGDRNMTLRTLADFLDVLDAKMNVEIESLDDQHSLHIESVDEIVCRLRDRNKSNRFLFDAPDFPIKSEYELEPSMAG